MSLTTFSQFFFGFTIDVTNNKLNFDEGGGELTATIDSGSFAMSDIATKLKTALDAAGALTYTVTLDRSTRKFTIAATGVFDLLITSGSQAGTSIFSLIGFTGSDVTGSASYESNTTAGSIYQTQFILQDHVASTENQEFVDALVNESSSGIVEVVNFGTKSLVQFNMRFITNINQSGAGVILNNASGVSNANTFMKNIIKKVPYEFMKDKNTPATFQKLLLDSTPESGRGTGYRLKEMNDLPGYFQTGILISRVLT